MEENGNVDISDLEDDTAWNDPTEWPEDIRKEKLKVSRLTRQKIMRDYNEETNGYSENKNESNLTNITKLGCLENLYINQK